MRLESQAVKFCLIPADGSRGEIRADAVQGVDVQVIEQRRSTTTHRVQIGGRIGQSGWSWVVFGYCFYPPSIPHTAAGAYCDQVVQDATSNLNLTHIKISDFVMKQTARNLQDYKVVSKREQRLQT